MIEREIIETVNSMIESKGKQEVALEIVQGDRYFLLSISWIKQILSLNEVHFSKEHPDLAVFQEEELQTYRLSDLLEIEQNHEDGFAILMQMDEEAFLLIVEQVLDVLALPQPYAIPEELSDELAYIDACYCLSQEQIAYLLNLQNLKQCKFKKNLQEGVL